LTKSCKGNGYNGNGRTVKRGEGGKFVKGTCGGPGNPYNRAAARFRSAFYKSVTEDDVVKAVEKLIEMAHGGDIHAIKEFLNRILGKAPQTLTVDEATDTLIDQLRHAKAEARASIPPAK
jgi:hypothetical protein